MKKVYYLLLSHHSRRVGLYNQKKNLFPDHVRMILEEFGPFPDEERAKKYARSLSDVADLKMKEEIKEVEIP